MSEYRDISIFFLIFVGMILLACYARDNLVRPDDAPRSIIAGCHNHCCGSTCYTGEEFSCFSECINVFGAALECEGK